MRRGRLDLWDMVLLLDLNTLSQDDGTLLRSESVEGTQFSDRCAKREEAQDLGRMQD